MAIWGNVGRDDVGNDLPWFWRTWIVCPRCAARFRLTAEETGIGPIAANITTTMGTNYGWRQVVESDTPLTAPTDSAYLHIDPAQIYGPCPWCGFNPIVVRGPDYGLARITTQSDSITEALQSYIAGGATALAFFATDVGGIAGILLLATNAPYQLDPTGTMARAIQRYPNGTLDALSYYPLATPARRLSPVDAGARDSGLVAIAQRLGLVVV